MADPRSTLTPLFQAAITAAFGASFADTDPALRRSDRADYQANAALGLAKKLGRPPREIASAIAEKLDLEGVCDRVEIAGAGFINVWLSPSYLGGELVASDGERLGVAEAASPEKVVIDYSSPNVAKEMHAGHLVGTVLGDAIARILTFCGHEVVRQNHLGEWGTPFGMMIERMIDARAAGADSLGEPGDLYREARAEFDANPAFAERSRRRVVLLQAGDAPTMALWNELMEPSRRYLAGIYERLDITLRDADICGESFYNDKLQGITEELETKGLARVSEGALCVFPAGFTGKGGEPLPLIVRKQDGGYGYATTDLAAVRYRTQTLGGTWLIYVVGAPQQQHLAMVFAVAREAGWLEAPARAEHVAFGSILGADKKMFRTRAGETVKLSDLIDEAVARARTAIETKSQGLGPDEKIAVAAAVGVGALKYAYLSSDRIKDHVFDWDRMLAFEGNTAPYLQYAHARIRSIFRRGGQGASVSDAPFLLTDPAERALALELASFGGAVAAAVETLEPHRLAGYLFTLATAFTTFYERCPVLRAESDELRRSRLRLADRTARVLAKGLGLLGIASPDQM